MPNKDKKYDLIVVGAGSGGLSIASFMNKIGLDVLLIDKSEQEIGGDCLNYGCVPSKSLIHVSRIIQKAKQAENFGLNINKNSKVDMDKVVDYIKSKQDEIREEENAKYLRKKGIDVVLGEAEFSGPNSVKINGENSKKNAREYYGKKIVIATGSKPRRLDIPGVDKLEYGKEYLDNETVFDLKNLPDNLLVIGGGPIGIELGQALNRLGSEVTVVQRGPRFLKKEREEVADILLKKLRDEGMNFIFNCEPTKFKSSQ